RMGDIGGLARAGCLYRPDPVLQEEAWQRLSGNTRAYSLCGITHTLSSTGAQRALTQYLTAPYEEWDAVICTSHAVRRAVDHITAEFGAYLAQRFGLPQPPRPALQLPVIPLGVHTADFDTTTKPMQAARARWRKQLSIGAKDVVALFVGRLAYHAKANPLPMYRALEAAQKRTKAKLHLVQVGWFGNEHIERAFKQGAKEHCPSVSCHFLDGRDPKVRADIWSVGDFFTSLVDNIQETFGLSPVEAMAAGLPVVASDWDGYRETVRHGEDGMLIRTLMSPPGTGEPLAMRHNNGIDNYDNYIAVAALNVAVDIAQTTDAYAALISDASLRARMAEQGRQRARETFEWKRIYGQYRELWGELAERRQAATQRAPRKQGYSNNPIHPDPFRLFAHYPTTTFGGKSKVRLAEADEAVWRATLALPLLTATPATMATADEALALRAALDKAGDPMEVTALLQTAAQQRREALARALALLLKGGLIEIDDRVEVANRAGPLS
ncbi:MAG TPA: glycosyltransferase family 4 protein, partial [Reyranellaceae bacterium]|nr:glycosyltransferase family 4 protein [Reyranellaceae bacterium]